MKIEFKKYLPWAILLVLVISLSTWYFLSRRVTQEQRDLYETMVNEAKSHVQAKQYSVGIKKYYEATEIIPRRIDAYEGIIEILIVKNRLDEAQDVIEKSAKALSNYDKSMLYKIVGDEYYELKNYSKAYELYDAGLFLGIVNMDLELMLGKTYLNRGKTSDARKQFTKGGYGGELLEEANLLLAYIYAVDDTNKAKATFQTLTVEEGAMQIYYDEFNEILDNLDEDRKFNSTKLARIYINNGYPHLAISILEPKKDELAEYLEGMYFLGRAYFETGQYDKAIETLNQALTLGGMEEDISWIKARAYFLTNDLDNAIVSYDSAIGYSGADISSDLVEEYVNFLLDNGQMVKALELVRSLLIPFTDEPYLNLLALKVNYELKEDTKVQFYLDRLEQLQQNTQFTKSQERELLQWKILTLLETNQDEWDQVKDEVDEYMESLFEMDKFNPYYRFFLAKIQIKEDEQELAIQSLEQAIDYDLDYVITDEALKLLSSIR